ncbi:MAG: hypothetical protein RMM53_05515 [Bacteroidia bacterium]|nr:hypothetical protein [Bacteroidia bacterium]
MRQPTNDETIGCGCSRDADFDSHAAIGGAVCASAEGTLTLPDVDSQRMDCQ